MAIHETLEPVCLLVPLQVLPAEVECRRDLKQPPTHSQVANGAGLMKCGKYFGKQVFAGFEGHGADFQLPRARHGADAFDQSEESPAIVALTDFGICLALAIARFSEVFPVAEIIFEW